MALIKSCRGIEPQFGEDVYLAENATVVGDVVMGDRCSVWFNAVIRGDVNSIRMGNQVIVPTRKPKLLWETMFRSDTMPWFTDVPLKTMFWSAWVLLLWIIVISNPIVLLLPELFYSKIRVWKHGAYMQEFPRKRLRLCLRNYSREKFSELQITMWCIPVGLSESKLNSSKLLTLGTVE